MSTHRSRRQSRRLLGPLGAIAAACLLAACGSAVVTPSPVATASQPTPTPGPSPTAEPATPASTPPGQTDTAWGRIWDALPAGFPTYPGAYSAETGEGPASAILDAGAATAADVATFYQSALEGAGYSTVARSGPSEDGSWEVVSAGGPGCLLQTTVSPMGGSTFVTIFFGAGCPLE